MTAIDSTSSRYLNAPFGMPWFATNNNNNDRSPSPASFDTFSPFSCSNLMEEEYQVMEDETCVRITMDMPGVDGRDISVSLEDGILTIDGYRRSTSGEDNDDDDNIRQQRRPKKQRLRHRFPVDTKVVDVSRAVAQMWKDSLVLYAPKRSINNAMFAQPEMEVFTPLAAQLVNDVDTTTANE